MTPRPPNSDVPGYAVVPSGEYRTIQEAHDDLPEEGGGIWLQDAVEESDVVLDKPVKLVGQGPGHEGTSGATIDTSGGDGIDVRSPGVTIRDVHVAGDRTGGYGIRLGGENTEGFSGKTTIRNVGISEKGGHGVLVDGGQLNNTFDVSVWDCAGNGWHFQGDWFNEHTFERMVAYGCDGDGVHIAQTMDPEESDQRSRFNGNTIQQFWMEHNEGWGLYVEDDVRMEGNHITGYGVEHNQGEGPNEVMRVKNLYMPPWREGTRSENILHLRNLIYGTVEVDREEFAQFVVSNVATGEDED